MKKSLLEHAMTYKKFVRQNNSKIQILKLLKDQKILKNQIIQNIYMTKNRKKKIMLHSKE